ncbi:MAG: hypothetical protein WBC44_11555 [Planctomycetaceae bacterium]
MTWERKSASAPSNSPFGEPVGNDDADPDGLRRKVVKEEVRLDGPKFDYRRELQASDGSYQGKGRASYDGETSARLIGSSDRERPAGGTIETEPYPHEVKAAYIGPLTLVYRPYLEGLWDLWPERWHLESSDRRIGDVSCIVIRQDWPEVPIVDEFWLDPAREFLPLRTIQIVEGKPRITTDIEYQRDEEHGWVPSGWRIVYVGEKGDLRETSEITVTHYEINQPIPHEEFVITFPAGAVVEDRRRSESKDGQPVRGRDHTIETAVPAAEVGRPVERSFRWWYLAAAGAAVLLLAAGLVYYRRQPAA